MATSHDIRRVRSLANHRSLEPYQESKEPGGSYPYTQDSQDMLDSTNGDPDIVNTIFTGDERKPGQMLTLVWMNYFKTQ